MEKSKQFKDLGALKVEDIESIIDNKVTLHHPNGVFEAKVKNVSKLKKHKDAPGREHPFSIIFECEDHVTPVQASVRIQHEDFGLENVLITPVVKAEEDKDKKNIYFQAIFS